MCRRMRHLKPREIQGCSLALDASIPTSLYDATSGGSVVAANGAVARWEDQSGNARHVTQATGANQPLRRVAARGGLDALQQNAAACNMATASFYPSSGAGDVTIVSVTIPYAAAYSCAWTYGQGAAAGKVPAWLPKYDTTRSAVDFFSSYVGRSGTPTESTSWHCHSYVASGAATVGDTSQWVNANAVTENYTLSPTTTLNVGAVTPFKIMNNIPNNNRLDYAAAFVTYSSALSNSVRRRLEMSMMRKWRIAG